MTDEVEYELDEDVTVEEFERMSALSEEPRPDDIDIEAIEKEVLGS